MSKLYCVLAVFAVLAAMTVAARVKINVMKEVMKVKNENKKGPSNKYADFDYLLLSLNWPGLFNNSQILCNQTHSVFV